MLFGALVKWSWGGIAEAAFSARHVKLIVLAPGGMRLYEEQGSIQEEVLRQRGRGAYKVTAVG